ncbi:MAG: thermonuclease family protein [Geobacteraceae bacterium]|nr:thermonuclease family protein [Geobacteraceae bacterium]
MTPSLENQLRRSKSLVALRGRTLQLRLLVFAALVGIALAAPACAADLHGRVSWIYDGDSIKVDGVGDVRLVGIDAPEKKGGYRDRDFLRLGADSPAQLRRSGRDTLHYLIRTLKGEQVRLEPEDPPRDKYGRLLAYVWLEDGNMLNRKLLRQGRVRVYRYFDFARKEEFLRIERKAIRAGRGMWD